MRNSGRCQTFRKSGLLRVRNEHNQFIRLRSNKWQCWRKHRWFQGHVDMLTEHISPRFVDLDSWSTADMTAAMYDGQLVACAAVPRRCRPSMPPSTTRCRHSSAAAAWSMSAPAPPAASRIRTAPSCLRPTTGRPSALVFVMAGGMGALLQSVEGAEDDEADGAERIAQRRCRADDVVIGVAASGTTPFTIGALRSAGDNAARSASPWRTTAARAVRSWRATGS